MTEQLETPRLLLRKAREGGLDAVFRNVWSDEALAATMLWQPTLDRDGAVDRLRRTAAYQAQYPAFFVALRDTDEVIGFAGVREAESGVYEESGIAIARAHQKKGYGREVLDALLRLVLRELGGEAFRYGCFSDNLPSRKLCLSAGFRYESTEEITRPWDEAVFSVDFFRLTRADYQGENEQ